MLSTPKHSTTQSSNVVLDCIPVRPYILGLIAALMHCYTGEPIVHCVMSGCRPNQWSEWWRGFINLGLIRVDTAPGTWRIDDQFYNSSQHNSSIMYALFVRGLP